MGGVAGDDRQADRSRAFGLKVTKNLMDGGSVTLIQATQ